MPSLRVYIKVHFTAIFWEALFEGMAAEIFTYSLLIWINLVYPGIFGTVLGFGWYYDWKTLT